MAESMAEVLAGIIAGVDEANNWDASPEMYQKYGDAILAAGFGLVADAGAKALEDAADELDLPGSDATGYYASEQDSGYREAERHAETYLRARAAAVRGEG